MGSRNVAEINATEFDIENVTVYKDRAAVRRRFPVDFEAGQNEIVISPLSSFLEQDSLRVETETPHPNQNLSVFDVVESYKDIDTGEKPEADQSLVGLRKERNSLNAHFSALEKQGDILSSYANSFDSKTTSTERLTDFLDRYVDLERTRNQELDTISCRLKEVAEEIAKKEAKKNAGANESNKVKRVTVIVSADEKGSAEIILSYIVKGASWFSYYDIRATINPSSPPYATEKTALRDIVSLQYRASIRQMTGENWNNVALTLSTASPMLGTAVPQLQPWFIGPSVFPMFQTQHVQPFAYFGSNNLMSTNMPTSPPSRAAVFGSTNRAVSANEGAVSSTFDVTGKSNIPSDDSYHKVFIASLDLVAELEWITIPRKTPVAILRCKVWNTSNFYLLSGSTSVFLDGTFVTRSRIPDVPAQDTFSCSLGIDPSVRITCHPQRKVVKTVDTSSIFVTSAQREKNKFQITTFSQRITIKNTRTTKIRRLIVRDQVPLSEDERIKVTLINPPDSVVGSPFESLKVDDGAATKSISKAKDKEPQYTSTDIVPRWTQKNGDSGGPKEDGILEWICLDIPPCSGPHVSSSKGDAKPGVVNIELEYEITAPLDVKWDTIRKA
ncbi:uncharacterized protein EI90DRAFT_3014164 [Cantharellus anzutake]|uniref:uncharacterized protein n=1 Tax=Cantharellus anzutake TaxID=1750568 RepID=UPI001904099B|nr:uncharacterized protein EI90DRAFT_3014164 [Cantharellus anzutake]KAF8336390.1 hypothetical protein EI90DRAFT_3014164 [Cantharellus anzutake]